MSGVEVRPISLPADAKQFVHSWWPIYEGDDNWVAPLVFERLEFFDPKKNRYFDNAEVQCFMAWRDGKAVGTISAQIDRKSLESEPGRGFFGFFEFIDDEDVARSLFSAACDWLRERGMTEVHGPYNFSSNHEFGCLIDGFVSPPVLNPYNRDYYGRIYDAIGMHKEMDWYGYWLDAGPVPPRIDKIATRFTSRNPEYSFRHMDMANYDQEVLWFWEIYNDAWAENFAHIDISEEEFFTMAQGLKEFLDPKLVWWAFVEGEESPIAGNITLPDVNQIVKRMNGGLFPFGWWHWVSWKYLGRNQPDSLRVFALGVKQKWQKKPIGAALYQKCWEATMTMDVKGGDASLVLETNHRMRGAIEKLGGRIYMTYRTYGYPLVEGAAPSDSADNQPSESQA